PSGHKTTRVPPDPARPASDPTPTRRVRPTSYINTAVYGSLYFDIIRVQARLVLMGRRRRRARGRVAANLDPDAARRDLDHTRAVLRQTVTLEREVADPRRIAPHREVLVAAHHDRLELEVVVAVLLGDHVALALVVLDGLLGRRRDEV